MESKSPALASETSNNDSPRPAMGQLAPTGRFDVFLSHNGRDKPVVERIAIHLKRAGLAPWLDSWMLVPGEAWRPELESGLMSSASCAVCIGQSGLSDWVNEEVSVAVNRAVKDRSFRVFLVLLPGLPEPFDPSTLPAFLSTRTWVDLRRGVDRLRDIQQLMNAIKGVPTGPTAPVEPVAGVCPYRGLQTFNEEQAEFFFGREADIQRLIERLKETRFLAVLGSSGVGKSSLVRAGLVPALRLNAGPADDGWTIGIFKPGTRPISELAAQLSHLDHQRPLTSLHDELMDDTRALDLAGMRILARNDATDRLIWVVDQFEEIFTLCHDERERSAFVGNLLHAATAAGGRTIVIVTMRADFYAQTARWPELAAQFAAHQYLVSPLSLDGMRQVIEQPARLVGLELEQGLTETILDDVDGQPGSLPLLEHALLELWERRLGNLLTLEAYRDAGAVQGAIAQRAETLFGTLTAEQQQIVRGVLLRLTQPGDGSVDTRRRARMDELVHRSMTQVEFETAIGPLIDARLLTTGIDEVTGEQELDVAHEALIRAWPRLRAWIDEDRSGLRTHRRLTEAAIDWERNGRDEGLLYRGARLATAFDWHATHPGDLNDLEDAFLTASARMRDRETRARQRRLRLTIAGLTVALLLISLTAVIANIQRNEAESERNAAQLARDEARSREITTTALAISATDPELALLLLAEALELTPTSEAQQALQYVLISQPHQAGGPLVNPINDGSTLWNLAMGPDGQTVATTIYDDLVRLWSMDGLKLLHALPGITQDAVYNGDGSRIATADLDGTLHVWNVASGRRILTIRAAEGLDCASGQGCYSPIAYSRDGQIIVSAFIENDSQSDDVLNRELLVWDATTGERLASFTVGQDGWILSPDGRYIATVSRSEIKLWDARTGQTIRSQPVLDYVEFFAFVADGSQFCIALSQGAIEFYDVPGFEPVRRRVARVDTEASVDGLIDVITVSPDGTLLARVFFDTAIVEVWDIETESLVSRLVGHSSDIDEVRFSPDNSLILTSSEDATERLWDTASGREVGRFNQSISNGFRHRAFTPDGRILIGAFSRGAIPLEAYSLDALAASDDELLRMARERVSRELTPEERRQYLHE